MTMGCDPCHSRLLVAVKEAVYKALFPLVVLMGGRQRTTSFGWPFTHSGMHEHDHCTGRLYTMSQCPDYLLPQASSAILCRPPTLFSCTDIWASRTTTSVVICEMPLACG